MNRRDFLQAAAMSAGGAIATTIITPEAARAGVIQADAIEYGQIITKEDLVRETAEMAKLADNVARVLINTPGPWRIHRYEEHGNTFVISGPGLHHSNHGHVIGLFDEQDPKYKLVYRSR